jgi:hypothetical protein
MRCCSLEMGKHSLRAGQGVAGHDVRKLLKSEAVLSRRWADQLLRQRAD